MKNRNSLNILNPRIFLRYSSHAILTFIQEVGNPNFTQIRNESTSNINDPLLSNPISNQQSSMEQSNSFVENLNNEIGGLENFKMQAGFFENSVLFTLINPGAGHGGQAPRCGPRARRIN